MTWPDGRLVGAISHAIAVDFPQTCERKQNGKVAGRDARTRFLGAPTGPGRVLCPRGAPGAIGTLVPDGRLSGASRLEVHVPRTRPGPDVGAGRGPGRVRG